MTHLTREEFALELETHAGALWCVAAAVLGDRDRARDVVQEAALIGLGRLEQFQRGSSFVHWMGQIVRFVALNQGRREKLRRGASGETLGSVVRRDAPREPSPVSRFGQVVEGQESFDDKTLRALRELDETARACLLMRTVLDMSYREISDALGIAEGTAMSHVHRSRQRMRESLRAVANAGREGARP
jgi:RNA polymerase sigma-70 factor (ECF subfamily)